MQSFSRLQLRALREEDEELYCDLFCEPHTMRYIGDPWSRQRAASSFRTVLDQLRTQPPTVLFQVLLEKATQQAIGVGSIQHLHVERRSAEIGVMLKPAACGRGLAKEATVALTAVAFAALPIDELRARFAAGHRAAERVLLGAGYSALPQEDPPLRTVCAYRASWQLPSTVTD